MKKLEEKSYYLWLEDVIREQNHNRFRFDMSSGERDAQMMLLVHYIEKHYPKMYEKLLAGTVDASANSNVTKDDVLSFLGKTEKGTCVTWKDMNGNEFLFINAGQGSVKNKRRILVMGNDDSKKDINLIKKAIVSELLRKDVEHVYEKIQKQEQKKKQGKTYLSEMFSQRNSITHTAGSFENNFKKMIKKQGFGASAMNTAQIMVRTMSSSEKKKLLSSFSAMGIKTGDDLEKLLTRWKDEALHERPRRSIGMSISNEMQLGM